MNTSGSSPDAAIASVAELVYVTALKMRRLLVRIQPGALMNDQERETVLAYEQGRKDGHQEAKKPDGWATYALSRGYVGPRKAQEMRAKAVMKFAKLLDELFEGSGLYASIAKDWLNGVPLDGEKR